MGLLIIMMHANLIGGWIEDEKISGSWGNAKLINDIWGNLKKRPIKYFNTEVKIPHRVVEFAEVNIMLSAGFFKYKKMCFSGTEKMQMKQYFQALSVV